MPFTYAAAYLMPVLTFSARADFILCGCASGQQAGRQLISAQLTPPSPLLRSPLRVPGQQAAVVKQGLLHVDASVLLRAHHVAVVAPLQLQRLVQVGGGALQR